MNSREVLKQSSDRLKEAGVPDPEYDSGMLLAHVTGIPWLELRMGRENIPNQQQEECFQRLLDRRAKREPLQYLLGTAFFCGFEFKVRPGVLIPRPETELLTRWAAQLLQGKKHPEILDLCCGSGCIGLSLGSILPGAMVTLTDLSGKAVALTGENLDQMHLRETSSLQGLPSGGTRFEILQGNLFEPVHRRTFDCIVSNPPYIPSEECPGLQEEVLWEPRLALDGGPDGLLFYRRIAQEGPTYLKPGGILLLEAGEKEAEPIAELLRNHGAAHTEVRKDDGGIDRMVLGVFDGAERKGHESPADTDHSEK